MENSKKLKKTSDEKVTRKEALQKAGKYAAFTAASMFLLLKTKEAAASEADPLPVWP